MELEEIKNKIIEDAKTQLRALGASNEETKENTYREFLNCMSAGKCRICKSPLEIVYAEENISSTYYKFACGHAWRGFVVKETMKIRDSLRLRKNKQGIRGFLLESIQGWFPSHREDLSPEGVTKVRIIDRENNYYKEEVVDQKTGRLIRFVEEKLSDHIR